MKMFCNIQEKSKYNNESQGTRVDGDCYYLDCDSSEYH